MFVLVPDTCWPTFAPGLGQRLHTAGNNLRWVFLLVLQKEEDEEGIPGFLPVGKNEESEEVIEGFVANCEKGRKGGRDVDSQLKF